MCRYNRTWKSRYGANGIARCDTDESDEGSLLDLPAVSTTDDILMSCLAVSMDGGYGMHTTVALAKPQHHQSGTESVSILTPSLRKGQSYIIHTSQG